MDDRAALRVALELLHVPWRVRLVRTQALPAGMPLLLGVASGDPASEQAAAEVTDRPPEVVRQAATFFIEQILLAPDADSYRMLGANPAATGGELRRNMMLLMRWLHPDIAREGEQSIYAARIGAAWNNLKSPDRRAAYDSELQAALDSRRTGHRGLRPARRGMGYTDLRRAGLPRVLALLLRRRKH